MGQQPTSFCGQIPESIRGRRRAIFQQESPPNLSVSWQCNKKQLEKIAEKQAETLAQSLKEGSVHQEQKLIGLQRKVEDVLWALTVTKQGHPGAADVGKLNPSARDGNSQLGYSEVQSPSRSFDSQVPTSSAEGQVGFEPNSLQTETQPQSPESPEPPKSHTDPTGPAEFVSALSQVLPFYAQQQKKSSVASTSTNTKLAAFSGNSALSWEPYFCHMRMVQKVNSWPDLQLAQEFGCKRQVEALEYYYTLEPSRRETDLTYVDKAMQGRFGNLTHPAALRSQLENLKQAPDQTLKDLAAHVRKLAYKVCADESPTSRGKMQYGGSYIPANR